MVDKNQILRPGMWSYPGQQIYWSGTINVTPDMLGQVAQEQGPQAAQELNTGRRVISVVGVNR